MCEYIPRLYHKNTAFVKGFIEFFDRLDLHFFINILDIWS